MDISYPEKCIKIVTFGNLPTAIMQKIKKHIFRLEVDLSFDMIGVLSHHTDYRLAWGINSAMRIGLEKKDEPFVVSGKKGDAIYSCSYYHFHDVTNRSDYFLLKNKANGKLLVPEKPTIDFFLFLCDNHHMVVEELLTQLRDIPSILAAYSYDPKGIESAKNLIFN